MPSVFWPTFQATVCRYFLTVRRAYPYSFFLGNLLTGLYQVGLGWLMYHVLFQGHVSGRFAKLAGTGDYLGYIVLGAVTYAAVVRTLLNVSRTLITERREGTLDALLVTPASRAGYLWGTMAAQTLTTLGEAALLVLLCLPFGVRFPAVAPGAALLGLLLSLLAMFGLSIVLGAVMLYTRDTYVTQNTLFLSIALLCGVSFPPAYLPSWAQWLGEALPVTWALQVLRGSLLGGQGVAELTRPLAMLAALALLYTYFGLKLMRRVEHLAMEHALS